MHSHASNKPNRRCGRALATMLVPLAVGVLVGWFAVGTVRDAWSQLTEANLTIRWSLLAAAGGIYLVALAPMAWYWRRVVGVVDRPVGWRPLLVAYYAGHLGKYVPGKAMVVVLRTAMLRRAGGTTGPLAASVAVETLTMMAAGAAIAAMLLLTGAGPREAPAWLLAVAIGMAILAATPTLPPVMRLVLRRTANPVDAQPVLSWRLLAIGWCAALASWVGLAASLWLVVTGCGGTLTLDAQTASAMLLATTLPYVAGFLSLIPGGLFVRDALVLRLLVPIVGEGTALAAAAAARLVWILAEAGIYVILVVQSRRDAVIPPTPATPSSSAKRDPLSNESS